MVRSGDGEAASVPAPARSRFWQNLCPASRLPLPTSLFVESRGDEPCSPRPLPSPLSAPSVQASHQASSPGSGTQQETTGATMALGSNPSSGNYRLCNMGHAV